MKSKMNKKTEVVVKLRWIEDAIVCHPKGGCEFHMREDGSGSFCAGCGCCQLAKAYVETKSQKKAPSKKPANKRCGNHPRVAATHQVYVKDCGKSSGGCDFEPGTPGHQKTRHYCANVCASCAERERADGYGTARI